METFLEAARRYTPISQQDAEYCYSFFKRKSYKKNSLLLEEGHVAHEVFFIEKGTLRQFFFNEKGVEKTCNFAFETDFLTDLESFSKQIKATTNIVALEATECLVMTCEDAAACMRHSAGIAAFFSRVIEMVATDNIRRIQSMLSQPPEQQFRELVQARPDILQRVPQRYVAQYLGVAPESLSRIRKRMLRISKS
ncbi:CRP-like cAMP-binding protein [Sphingobacterium allocomposti]|uniref:CRP-like cAMP-binding protein n=1 Tax=Sphingobacterium allocomposti TaxID=415956 RepID=A0A5S5DJY1_9SPHI|nr:Crp/Fnr family transcriptional regulator [Sphingobacterium composti Yoo et al. 2007 non Ten et al. 2007]TYP96217.1 CRP-like cAMP-binding protein [Sphingobacterium composti Yoo et al. 2007 non Ten et al. 2007]